MPQQLHPPARLKVTATSCGAVLGRCNFHPPDRTRPRGRSAVTRSKTLQIALPSSLAERTFSNSSLTLSNGLQRTWHSRCINVEFSCCPDFGCQSKSLKRRNAIARQINAGFSSILMNAGRGWSSSGARTDDQHCELWSTFVRNSTDIRAKCSWLSVFETKMK
jgi:hypothetical protein